MDTLSVLSVGLAVVRGGFVQCFHRLARPTAVGPPAQAIILFRSETFGNSSERRLASLELWSSPEVSYPPCVLSPLPSLPPPHSLYHFPPLRSLYLFPLFILHSLYLSPPPSSFSICLPLSSFSVSLPPLFFVSLSSLFVLHISSLSSFSISPPPSSFSVSLPPLHSLYLFLFFILYISPSLLPFSSSSTPPFCAYRHCPS